MFVSLKKKNIRKKFFTVGDILTNLQRYYSICASLHSLNQIPVSALVSFVDSLEVGYSTHKNPYHNLVHAADVTQTLHYLLIKTGILVSPTAVVISYQECVAILT